MDLRQIEHFVAVAEEGHFNRAAERCHIVRSGLSASIRSLERDLGARLFLRTTHEVRLTDAGEALLAEARRILAAADAAREAVSGVGNLLRGTLTVATGQPFGEPGLPALLAQYHAAHPAVRIAVVRSTGLDMEEKVRNGDVDLAFGFLSAPPSEGLCVDVLATGPMVLACSSQHRLASREAIRIEELREETFIMVPPKWGKRTAVDEAFDAAGVDRELRLEVTDRGFYADLVRAGLGVAVMPGAGAASADTAPFWRADATDEDTAARGQQPPIRYLPILDAPQSTYVMIAPLPELRTAAARAFISVVDEVLQRVPER